MFNTFTNEKQATNAWQRLNAYMYEWELEVNRIKRVPILSMEGTGANVSDIVFRFSENYYQKYDMFIVEDLRKYFQVMNRPQRIADNCFVVIAKLVTDDYSEAVPSAFVSNAAGKLTRFVTNNVPELHEEG